MSTISTGDFGLNVRGFAPEDVLPNSLVVQTSSKAGFVEGDAPVVQVPYVSVDDDAAFTAEGAQITEADPDSSVVEIATGKVSVLVKVSRERWLTGDTASLLSDSTRRAVIKKANRAYLAQAAPTSPAITPPAGLLNQAPTAGGALDANLDALADAVATIEGASGTATHIVTDPTAWSWLTQFKTGTGSNQSLVGAGTEAAQKALSSLPVISTNAMTAGKLLVLDKSAVLSAYGEVLVATSEHAAFTSDSVMLRVTFRFGARLVEAAGAVLLTVTDPNAA